MPYSERLKKLQSALAAERVDSFLVLAPANLRYLTGFTGSNGLLLVEERGAVFFTDGRYTTQAGEEVRNARVVTPKKAVLDAAIKLAAKGGRRVGFETSVSYPAYARLAKQFKRRLRPLNGVVEKLRLVKEDGEVAAIRASVELNSRVFDEMLPLVKEGVSEQDLAAEVEYRMRRHGAGKASFDTIVASGPRSALPHAPPSARRLRAGEFVLFDQGAILNGYASDMTRTVFLGRAGREARRLYATVLEAQQQARQAVRAGVRGAAVDRAARRVIRQRGWGRYFSHSTGHGVGLEIHEMPRLAAGDRSPLPAGAVVTIEPGVYLPGFAGVRIEDMLVVREGGSDLLTPTPHDLIEL
jgi:Xaa-Pro aminopeptidase